VPSELLAERYRPELDELRCQATEARADALVRLGRHQDAITELIPLVAAEPLRERLHELLMLALYRDGQRAAALSAYRQARVVLVTTVGIEPGRALQDLHHTILRGEPA
jgi:DNA-binding SARP family transcriptional activator